MASKLLTDLVKDRAGAANLKAKYLAQIQEGAPRQESLRASTRSRNKMDIAILSEVTEQIPLAR